MSRPFPTSGSSRSPRCRSRRRSCAAGFELVHLALPPGLKPGEGLGAKVLGVAAQLRRDPRRAARVRRRRRRRPIPAGDLDALELELVMADLDERRAAAQPAAPGREERRQGDRGRGRGARAGARGARRTARRSRGAASTADDLARARAGVLPHDQADARRAQHRRGGRRRRERARCPTPRRCRSTSKPRSRRARPRTAPRCARCTASASRRSTPSRTRRTTCSAGARSSRPAKTSRARGRSAPARRRPSARA